MKMNCKQFKDLIFVFQDGRLAEREKTEFERHHRSCPDCARLLGDAGKVGDWLQDTAAPVPAPDWDKSWRAIAATLPPRLLRKAPALLSPRWAYVIGGFLVCFILGVAAARFFLSPVKAGKAAPSDALFLYSAQDYFAALQPVMASYANAVDSQGNISADQARVRRLLSDLYLLKSRAAKSRDTSLQHLLGDIELVLLEIAHLDRSDPEQVRQVGAMIEEKGISMKMKVYKFERRKPVRI
jgi:hypothetical protein